MSPAITHPSVVWFRQDLRLADNPALFAAAAAGEIIPIYILDDIRAGDQKMGAASRWWLHYALLALNKSLSGRLRFYCGDADELVPAVIRDNDVKAIYWNRCYEPWRLSRDVALQKSLEGAGIKVHISNGSLLWDPSKIKKGDGTPYKVFTPYYRKGCLSSSPPRSPLPIPKNLKCFEMPKSFQSLECLKLLPEIRWDISLKSTWEISEEAAHNTLDRFIKKGLSGYKERRNFPEKDNVSRLSPYLHFGQISPNAVWYESSMSQIGIQSDKNLDHFKRELGWREFSHYLLYHFPSIPSENLQSRFNDFPWKHDPRCLKLWQVGATGFPLIDAGMKELWETGYMHNRVRMVVASFLVKNLQIHWRHGAAWFWDCLVDADLANNSASWQWVAGSGADAAPFFRIFNPIIQSQKFDRDGSYIRRFLPALANMPAEHIHTPWLAPPSVLENAGIRLGNDYPEPIVDVRASRERALRLFSQIKIAKKHSQ